MIILLIVLSYIVVGLVVGSATTRVGYALDKDVRRSEANLQDLHRRYLEAKQTYQALPPKKSAAGSYDEPWYSQSRDMNALLDQLVKTKNNAESVFEKNRVGYMWFGISMMVFWAPAIPVGVAAGLLWFSGKLAVKGLQYAFSPSRYDSHKQLMQEAVR